jgi:ATP-dependent Clp protease protease subunit
MDDTKATEDVKALQVEGQALWAQQCLITGANFAQRRIYLVGEITDAIAYRFMLIFDVMDSVDGPIQVFIHTPGGEETSGYAIYDKIVHGRNRVETVGIGGVLSIASMIFQAGDIRSLYPQALLLIHNGSLDMGENGTTIPQDRLVEMGEEIKKGNAKYHKILSERSGKKLSEVKALCEKETVYNAEEAVAAGFADRIVMGKRYAKNIKKVKKGKSK